MKKITSIIAVAAFVVALSSCGNKTTETGAETTTETTVTEEVPGADATVTTETTVTTDSSMEVKTDTTSH